MDLTAEQEEQVRQAKAKGDHRVLTQFTAEQKRQWQEIVDQELAATGENAGRFRKMKAAAQEAGLLGDIRRAMMLSPRSIADFAEAIQIDQHLLSDFCAGEADLPMKALDRLVEALGLRLMKEIPR